MISNINYVTIVPDEKEKKRRLEFGREFKAARHSRYLSRTEAAKITGLSLQAIVRIELGLVSPNSLNFKKVLDRLMYSEKMVISL